MCNAFWIRSHCKPHFLDFNCKFSFVRYACNLWAWTYTFFDSLQYYFYGISNELCACINMLLVATLHIMCHLWWRSCTGKSDTGWHAASEESAAKFDRSGNGNGDSCGWHRERPWRADAVSTAGCSARQSATKRRRVWIMLLLCGNKL